MIVSNSVFLSGDSAGPFPTTNVWYDHQLSITGALGVFGTAVNFLTIGLRRGTTGDNSFSWEVGDVYTQEADFAAIDAGVGSVIAQSAWLTVGGTGVAFNTGWANVGTGLQTAAYRKDSNGVIHLRGVVVRSSGVLTTIFTLPAGMRPALACQFPACSAGAFAEVDVGTGGNVVLAAGAATSVSLDGITFDTL